MVEPKRPDAPTHHPLICVRSAPAIAVATPVAIPLASQRYPWNASDAQRPQRLTTAESRKAAQRAEAPPNRRLCVPMRAGSPPSAAAACMIGAWTSWLRKGLPLAHRSRGSYRSVCHRSGARACRCCSASVTQSTPAARKWFFTLPSLSWSVLLPSDGENHFVGQRERADWGSLETWHHVNTPDPFGRSLPCSRCQVFAGPEEEEEA